MSRQYELPFVPLCSSRLMNHADSRKCYEWVRDNGLEIHYIHMFDSLEDAIKAPCRSNGVSRVMFRFVYFEDYALFRLKWSDR